MMDLAGYYWDSCVWIDLIRGSDNDRVKRARHLLRLALQGKVTLYISAITLVEVHKASSVHEDSRQLDDGIENSFSDFIKRHVPVLGVSEDVDILAGWLRSEHPHLAKSGLTDLIHVATCIAYNIHVLHTFDEKLLSQGIQLRCLDKKELTICEPGYLEE